MDSRELIDRLYKEGVLSGRDVIVEPLSGGVSSKILLLDDGEQKVVFKQSKSKLDVADDWYADPARNVTEQDFIIYVRRYLPDAVPMMYYRDRLGEYFIMEYLGEAFKNWKEQLLAGTVDRALVEQSADILATIHGVSRSCSNAAELFDTTGHFYDLRLDPYLITTANRHRDLAPFFEQEVIRLVSHREALVHGDFSPKNLMVGENGRMVLLDHEVAWFGDPAFDVAFMLTHLNIKKLLHVNDRIQEAVDDDLENPVARSADWFWRRYSKQLVLLVDDIDLDELDKRVSQLLLMLMLARVDGKSPLEYLGATQARKIREFVYSWLPEQEIGLQELHDQWLLHIIEESV